MDGSDRGHHRHVHGSERRGGVRGQQLVARGPPAHGHDRAGHRPREHGVSQQGTCFSCSPSFFCKALNKFTVRTAETIVKQSAKNIRGSYQRRL